MWANTKKLHCTSLKRLMVQSAHFGHNGFHLVNFKRECWKMNILLHHCEKQSTPLADTGLVILWLFKEKRVLLVGGGLGCGVSMDVAQLGSANWHQCSRNVILRNLLPIIPRPRDTLQGIISSRKMPRSICLCPHNCGVSVSTA